MDSLDGQRTDLARLLAGERHGAEHPRPALQDLQTLITAGDRVVSATAARNAALQRHDRRAARFLSRLRTTLASAGHTLALAAPTVTTLQGVAPLLRPALSDVITLSGPVLTLLHRAPTLLHDALVATPGDHRLQRRLPSRAARAAPGRTPDQPVIDYVGLYRRSWSPRWPIWRRVETTAPAQTDGWPDRRGRPATCARSRSWATRRPSDSRIVSEPTNRNNTYFSPGELYNVARAACSRAIAPTPTRLPVPLRLQECPLPSAAGAGLEPPGPVSRMSTRDRLPRGGVGACADPGRACTPADPRMRGSVISETRAAGRRAGARARRANAARLRASPGGCQQPFCARAPAARIAHVRNGCPGSHSAHKRQAIPALMRTMVAVATRSGPGGRETWVNPHGFPTGSAGRRGRTGGRKGLCECA